MLCLSEAYLVVIKKQCQSMLAYTPEARQGRMVNPNPQYVSACGFGWVTAFAAYIYDKTLTIQPAVWSVLLCVVVGCLACLAAHFVWTPYWIFSNCQYSWQRAHLFHIVWYFILVRLHTFQRSLKTLFALIGFHANMRRCHFHLTLSADWTASKTSPTFLYPSICYTAALAWYFP